MGVLRIRAGKVMPGVLPPPPPPGRRRKWWTAYGLIPEANCIAAYQPKGAASLAASYDNLAAPGNGLPDGTYDAAPGVAPTWAAGTGWTFDGIGQILMTGLTPINDQGWSVLMQFDVWASGNQAVGYWNGVASALALGPKVAANRTYDNGGNLTIAGGAMLSGNIGIAGTTGYSDGIADPGAIAAGPGAAMEMSIGALNAPVPGPYYWGGRIQAVSIYRAILTAAQFLDVATAMAAL